MRGCCGGCGRQGHSGSEQGDHKWFDEGPVDRDLDRGLEKEDFLVQWEDWPLSVETQPREWVVLCIWLGCGRETQAVPSVIKAETDLVNLMLGEGSPDPALF